METHSAGILLQIFLMFTVAKVFSLVGERLRLPGVIAEIAAGVLIGPYALGLVRVEEWTLALAEIGVIILLFDVGLEQKLTTLFRVGWTALLVAVLGVVAPFFLGYGLMRALDHNQIESVFIGAAMVATSVGITARVLQDVGAIQTVVAAVILGAAVIDDILGMILLAVVSSMSAGTVNYVHIGIVTAEAVGFTIFIILAGKRVMRRLAPRMARLAPAGPNPYFPLALIICLGLSVVAVKIGIAAIIGAFLAGLVFSEEELTPRLREKTHSVYEFLVPFFFVTMGMKLDLRVFLQTGTLYVAVLVTLLAILGKLVGCGAGAYALGFKNALKVGVGMIPRGEVGIIVALIGLGLHTISDAMYAVVIFMTVATTLLAPPFLKLLFAREASAVPAPEVVPEERA